MGIYKLFCGLLMDNRAYVSINMSKHARLAPMSILLTTDNLKWPRSTHEKSTYILSLG